MTSWLQIQAVRPSDEGTYRCLARNALGQVEAPASLTVLTPGKGGPWVLGTGEDGGGFGPLVCIHVCVHVGAHASVAFPQTGIRGHGEPLFSDLSPLPTCVCRPAELHRHPPATVPAPGP